MHSGLCEQYVVVVGVGVGGGGGGGVGVGVGDGVGEGGWWWGWGWGVVMGVGVGGVGSDPTGSLSLMLGEPTGYIYTSAIGRCQSEEWGNNSKSRSDPVDSHETTGCKMAEINTGKRQERSLFIVFSVFTFPVLEVNKIYCWRICIVHFVTDCFNRLASFLTLSCLNQLTGMEVPRTTRVVLVCQFVPLSFYAG